jgi:hypothetical protein
MFPSDQLRVNEEGHFGFFNHHFQIAPNGSLELMEQKKKLGEALNEKEELERIVVKLKSVGSELRVQCL